MLCPEIKQSCIPSMVLKLAVSYSVSSWVCELANHIAYPNKTIMERIMLIRERIVHVILD